MEAAKLGEILIGPFPFGNSFRFPCQSIFRPLSGRFGRNISIVVEASFRLCSPVARHVCPSQKHCHAGYLKGKGELKSLEILTKTLGLKGFTKRIGRELDGNVKEKRDGGTEARKCL